MFASAASSERPRDIFREPALSVGIFSLGARFAASDDCNQHPGGCAKNFRRSRDKAQKVLWKAQAASLLFSAAGTEHACGLCAKRTFCPLTFLLAAESNSAGRTDWKVCVPAAMFPRLTLLIASTLHRFNDSASDPRHAKRKAAEDGAQSKSWRTFQPLHS
jgi:hypothetical protein